ncbi:pteridine reductase [Streptosporangium jomthongense]|uniref:SDR family NAD(P)-dependent oxidoreductase n=1 Tax=Marinobacter aromaticivorans TaxID=1494078 RepID=A0ABW2IUM4_9GAMM|nr:SDR family NAD(P)-dependent oxidoreductase [Marinobacter aromaticivorans]GGE62429.1 pteridine reductase [Streptosporangium jomthongense]
MATPTPAPVAVITGGARRLGYHISQALLERGYRLFVLYRSTTPELEQLESRGVVSIHVDLAEPGNVQGALERIRSQAPHIHVLVNNASEFYPDMADTLDLATQTNRLFQINSTAPMMLMHGLQAQLVTAAKAQGTPSLIVNITDIFSERPNPRFAAYCASKAALSSLTLSYAGKLAPNVRVNAIMPGPIGFLPSHTDDQKKQVLSETLLPREGGFHSVVIQLLALIDNDFITGAQIPVDGGRRLAQGMSMQINGDAG